MAGFSGVTDGVISQFKGRLTKAGITPDHIERVASGNEWLFASGMIVPLLCLDLCRVESFKPDRQNRLIGSDLYLALDPDTKPEPDALSVKLSGRGSRSGLNGTTLRTESWMTIGHEFEARLHKWWPGEIEVRRILKRGEWVCIADSSWEARFSDESFELRVAGGESSGLGSPIVARRTRV